MKKIALVLSVMSLVVSCGDGEKNTENLTTPDGGAPVDGAATDLPALQPTLDAAAAKDVAIVDAPTVDSGSVDTGAAESGATPMLDSGAIDRPAADAGAPAEAGRSNDAGAIDGGAVVVDPAPTITTPGVATIPATCSGCPTSADNTFTINAGAVTSQRLQGQITGATGNGTFYVESAPDASGNVQRISGPVAVGSSGSYDVTIPLFCGAQLVKLVFTNSAGTTVIVKQITTSSCSASDIRVTISWDGAGDDWELHLLKPGGRLNDQTNLTDCTWTTCLGAGPDWGIKGDTSDNPRKDVDDTDTYGPENIYLSKPETGRYTVMVEHWGPGAASTGQAIINVRGAAYVFNISGFLSHWVWTVATIDWPAGTVTPVDTRADCSATWSNGCVTAVP